MSATQKAASPSSNEEQLTLTTAELLLIPPTFEAVNVTLAPWQMGLRGIIWRILKVSCISTSSTDAGQGTSAAGGMVVAAPDTISGR